jgi:hypothetical protein
MKSSHFDSQPCLQFSEDSETHILRQIHLDFDEEYARDLIVEVRNGKKYTTKYSIFQAIYENA